jgi:hypothetical protein
MLKYQGSTSPHIKKRIQADLKTVPDCELKTLWLEVNRVSIGYADGVDTSSSTSSSIYSSSYSSEEDRGAGEGTNFIPETPAQAAEHPDIVTYQQISGRFPGERDYGSIIETMQYLRKKHGDKLTEVLTPYWTAWSTRKAKGGKPYNPASLVWLYEWAMQGTIPSANGHEPQYGETKIDRKAIIRKVAQNANAHA